MRSTLCAGSTGRPSSGFRQTSLATWLTTWQISATWQIGPYEAGASTIRYGFPWYRVNPARGVYTWDWTDRVVDRLCELGLEVIVDLVHYGTPRWLDNHFLNRNYPDAVAEYAARLAARYGDRLTAWTPLNEPQWTARLCGESGTWPPYLTGHDGYLQLMRNIARGIVATQHAVADTTAGRATIVGGRERDDGVAGLEELVRETAARYGVPVMLTETSYEGTWEQRAAWLRDSVALLRRLRGEVDVDGAGHVQIFLRVLAPLLVPAVAAFAIFQFLWVWNDLLVALTFANTPGTNPMTVALANLAGSRGSAWYLLSAAAFVSMVVPLAVFLSMQRFFVRGLLAGSVKG
ncbi:family 1 glycosylhydrolase [Dactylosporangium sp. NPDC050588]|uniref:family 1 glycosylhydrolase n=1 Tax=Dactylosporangium sp. NPDC050588 TaxID=3157211 RepID=UPI0033D10AC1